MKKLLIATMIVLCGCGGTKETAKSELLTPQVFAEEAAANPDAVILDVRTPEEFQSGHIQGAVMLDFQSPSFADSVQKLDHGKTYLVYCAAGKRSAKAAAIMKEKGFTSVLSLDGGLNAWQAAGQPVVQN